MDKSQHEKTSEAERRAEDRRQKADPSYAGKERREGQRRT